MPPTSTWPSLPPTLVLRTTARWIPHGKPLRPRRPRLARMPPRPQGRARALPAVSRAFAPTRTGGPFAANPTEVVARRARPAPLRHQLTSAAAAYPWLAPTTAGLAFIFRYAWKRGIRVAVSTWVLHARRGAAQVAFSAITYAFLAWRWRSTPRRTLAVVNRLLRHAGGSRLGLAPEGAPTYDRSFRHSTTCHFVCPGPRAFIPWPPRRTRPNDVSKS